MFYGGQYIKVLSVSGDTIIPAPSALDMGISGNRQHILMVGTNIVAVWHDGSQHSYAAVITRDGTELTCGAPYEWLEGYAESAVMAVSETKFTILFAVESERLKSTTLEVWSGRISGSFVNESSQAIALEDGGAGENIELLFSGTAELPGLPAGTRISGDSGVQGYAPVDGWLYATPYWASPQVTLGSYAGTGTYGAENPNTLTFPFTPRLVLIEPGAVLVRGSARGAYAYRDSNNNEVAELSLTWSGNGVSWYNVPGNYSASAEKQLNTSGQVYHYVAIG